MTMTNLLLQTLRALETDDFLKKLEAARQIRLELERRKWPIVHEVYEEKSKTDKEVTPEFLDWLRRLYPERNGVAGNEAWNAGVAWARQESMAGPEYYAIKSFYGDREAKRSGFKLMRHIEEGLNILDAMGASSKAKKAFCIHPLVQNNEGPEMGASEAYDLACEYRDRANAYLCKPDTDKVNTVADVFKLVGPMSKDCRDMLVADKRQNFADFILAHYRKHPRSKELFMYFQLWLAYLDSPIAVLRES